MLIELSHPRVVGTVWVHTPWTQLNLLKTVKAIPSPKTNVNDFMDKIKRPRRQLQTKW